MASLKLTSTISLRSPEFSGFTRIHRSSVKFNPTTRPIFLSLAASSDEPIPSSSNPQIDLEFIAAKRGNDGSYGVKRAKEISGEKLLRNIMMDNKIDMYATYGKLMNCGGGGSCGTCIVEILEGDDLLNEKTNTELRYLKNKPDTWRLACQTIVGNKENSGKVKVQTIPQWKK